jgi:hypothetical protein
MDHFGTLVALRQRIEHANGMINRPSLTDQFSNCSRGGDGVAVLPHHPENDVDELRGPAAKNPDQFYQSLDNGDQGDVFI